MCFRTFASVLCCLLGLSASAWAVPGPRTYTAGDWVITVTRTTGTATGPGGKIRSLWSPPKPRKGCDEQRSGRILSIVGTYVSFESQGGGFCQGAAHPYAFTQYVALDLATGKPVSLYKLFARKEVAAAIAADSFLKQEANDPDAECRFTLIGMETSYAFLELAGAKVAVRVGLSHGCEAMRGRVTQLGLLLTPKPDLLVKLQAASQAGTLMNKLTGGK
jgi:hypothetical protein